MNTIYTREMTVLPSQVDPKGRLSVPVTFDLFMDTATEAADALGLGMGMLLRRGLFWITVKTRFEFIEKPALMDRVQLVTWPHAPAGMRCERSYEVRREGKALIRGKTEWAIVDARTGRPQPLEPLMPEGIEYPAGQASPEPFPMIDEAFPDPPFAQHRVSALDIDMARHMNNVAYVRALVNAFSVEEWQRMDIRQIDVIFRASAHEGDILQIQQRRTADTLDLRAALPTGETSVLARMRIRQ